VQGDRHLEHQLDLASTEWVIRDPVKYFPSQRKKVTVTSYQLLACAVNQSRSAVPVRNVNAIELWHANALFQLPLRVAN
jgi:hypothetical protein